MPLDGIKAPLGVTTHVVGDNASRNGIGAARGDHNRCVPAALCPACLKGVIGRITIILTVLSCIVLNVLQDIRNETCHEKIVRHALFTMQTTLAERIIHPAVDAFGVEEVTALHVGGQLCRRDLCKAVLLHCVSYVLSSDEERLELDEVMHKADAFCIYNGDGNRHHRL